ncbi:MAG TPA: PhzF family phenazine biosynthesis protein [Acidimicrobiales bacterium]|nr:PhzF family phenazine biosynthesis protein [Acidimicrobiales bacterium]
MELTVVDAFTDRPFAGNPAAVAVVDAFPDEARMQAVAREMHLSETAFVVPRADGAHDLRWFTPSVEVDLCGHATLASAHVLGGTARFHTRSGELACAPAGDGWIEMDFPADVLTPEPPGSEAARQAAEAVGDTGLVVRVARGRTDVLVEMADAGALRALEPSWSAVAALAHRCVIVTAPGDRPGIDCVSRVFAPNAGIAEDPVTGSAHCSLAVHWGGLLGRHELVGEQASARGGVVRMRRHGDRVVIGGRAVTVSQVRLVV